MTSAAEIEKPFHLQGNFAPVTEEVTGFDLPVEGALPPELCGLYARQSPNPKTGATVLVAEPPRPVDQIGR